MNRLHAVIVSVAALLVVAAPSTGRAGPPADRHIGLLELPQLFGRGACDDFTAQPLALYAGHDNTVAIGEIRVDRPWSFPKQGGCEGLEVNVHLFAAAGGSGPLPTREYGYEEPGAIVLGRRGGRFKIALDDGGAWVEPLSAAVFHPIETLVKENLSYLTAAWNGKVCAVPGESGGCRQSDAGEESEPGVTVLGHRDVDGRLWFEIELPARESCGDPDPSRPRTRGWIEGHDNNGKPAIWFYSRGC